MTPFSIICQPLRLLLYENLMTRTLPLQINNVIDFIWIQDEGIDMRAVCIKILLRFSCHTSRIDFVLELKYDEIFISVFTVDCNKYFNLNL